jgi:sigma-B regulation protein RsbU (phosphoserine phosphatase)
MSPQKGFADNLLDILTTQVAVKQQEIDALLDLTRAINSNVPSADLLQIYDLTLAVHLRVKSIAIYLHDTDWLLAFQRKAEDSVKRINVERDLLPFTEVTHFDGSSDVERPEALSSFDLVIPVLHKDEAIAYVCMCYPHRESYEVMEEKVRFIQAFTNIVAVAIENKKLFKRQLEQERFKKEMDMASQVQTMLIPDHLPNDERFQMAAVYRPHRNVGGDYYDIIPLSENEMMFCIADVSGKGTGAALLMANFQAQVRALSHTAGLHLKQFVRQLNENMLVATRAEKFITMFLGRYNSSSRRLTYISCGHNPSIFWDGKDAQLLGKGCTILGMFDELPKVEVGYVDVPENAVLLNYTDGVTDIENEKELNYSTDHMVHHLQRRPDQSMEELTQGIMQEIYQFKGEREYVDDISMLAIRFK